MILIPWEVKKLDGKFCVYKKGESSPVHGGNGSCHDTREQAVKQMRALYANETPTMHSAIAFSDVVIEDSEGEPDNVKWIKAWRYSSWQHPKYGLVEITPSMGLEFKKNFDEGVIGRQHIINYDHAMDPAKGGKAAGTILDVDPREDGIYYKVMFTKPALEEVQNGEWLYISPEYKENWTDPETNQDFSNVPFDLALTNQPFFGQQVPLNFSELGIDLPDNDDDDDAEGGSEVDELLKKFADKLGIEIEDDADESAVLKAAEDLNKVIEPLRKAKDEGARMRTFREAFPEEWKEMERLREARVESDALTFAESYQRFTVRDGENSYKSTYGFSQLVVDKIAEVHKKFSLKEADSKDLRELLDLIGDKGIVDYSESGSSRNIDGRIRSDDPKIAFSEAVLEIQEKDSVEYEVAIRLAAQRYPELYDAYQKAVPQR